MRRIADAPVALKIVALVFVSAAFPLAFAVNQLRANYAAVETFGNDVEQYATANRIKTNHRGMLERLGAFLESGADIDLNRYNEMVDEFVSDLDCLERTGADEETAYLLHALWNSFGSWYDEAHAAIRRRRSGTADCYSFYYRAERISRYLDSYIDQLLDRTLAVGTGSYRARAERARIERNFSTALLAVFGAASLASGIALSSLIARPIRRLAEAAGRMASGEPEAAALPVGAADEIGALTASFNTMSAHIADLVKGLKEKASIEKRLHRQELKNAAAERRRKEAEFLALQARINPHFLFNSLNSISRDILVRGGGDAVELIEALSALLRYGLEQGGGVVSLATELEIVRKYAFIQSYRFEDRVRISIACRVPEPESILLPAFSVQPLVENSIIHGIEPRLSGGAVEVEAFRRGPHVVVRVSDDGIGIGGGSARSRKPAEDRAAGGHTSSIGLANVRGRLRLFTGDPRCFSIRNRKGGGVAAELRLGGRTE